MKNDRSVLNEQESIKPHIVNANERQMLKVGKIIPEIEYSVRHTVFPAQCITKKQPLGKLSSHYKGRHLETELKTTSRNTPISTPDIQGV